MIYLKRCYVKWVVILLQQTEYELILYRIYYLTIMNHGATNSLVHENQQDTYRLLYLDHMKKNLVQMNSVQGSYEPMASGPEEQQQPY